MNDPMIALYALDRIIEELRDSNSSTRSKKEELYDLASAIKIQMSEYLEEIDDSGYGLEKLNKTVLFIGAITGFGDSTGLEHLDLRASAMGQASSLRERIMEKIGRKPHQ